MNDNDAEEEATIDVLIPNLSIIDIQEVSDGRNVITELDQDLDEGNIRFERNRYGEWESIE